MTTAGHAAHTLADTIANRLTHPDTVPAPWTSRRWWRQSLAHGAPGVALLHIERAAAGLAPWQPAHDWLTYTTRGPVTTGPDSHLYYGAPALAHALACAAATRPGCYERALDTVDHTIIADVHRRVAAAHARIDRGDRPALAEFDVIRGLAGVGSYLLRRHPDSEATRAVLDYLVRLTQPVTVDGETLPGWWTPSAPSGRDDRRFDGGHANTGLAHGISVI